KCTLKRWVPVVRVAGARCPTAPPTRQTHRGPLCRAVVERVRSSRGGRRRLQEPLEHRRVGLDAELSGTCGVGRHAQLLQDGHTDVSARAEILHEAAGTSAVSALMENDRRVKLEVAE